MICQICYHHLSKQSHDEIADGSHDHSHSNSKDNVVSKNNEIDIELSEHQKTLVEIQTNVEQMMSTMSLSSKQVQLQVEGSLLLHIDSRLRIYKIEMTVDL